MTIEYKEDQMSFIEENDNRPLIGYFEPNGEFIDFNILLDVPTHDGNSTLPPAYAFLDYVSYIVKDTDYAKIGPMLGKEHLKYPGIKEIVMHGYDYKFGFGICSLEELKKKIDKRIQKMEKIINNNPTNSKEFLLYKWTYDMLLFLKNAYSKKPFFEAISRQIRVDNIDDLFEKYNKLYGTFVSNENSVVHDIQEQILKNHFKDINVQYLGYDALETYSPNGEPIKPVSFKLIVEDGPTDFQKTPRVITSSVINPNERFFNYLIMGWKVHRLPRYRFNDETGMYSTEYLELYHDDKIQLEEQIYEKEIKKIKKLVPLEKRPSHFIK